MSGIPKLDFLSESIASSKFKTNSEAFILTNDHYELEKFFRINKFFVSNHDRVFLQRYIIAGLPPDLRRTFWMTVSGAYSYMKDYSAGYY
jgi:hypothetical protein